MIKLLFSPPIIYYLIIIIILLSLLAYRRREFIKKELRRWRAKEISAGPIKFERDIGQAPKKRGVQIGLKGDFSGAKLKNIAGRDILQGDELVSNNTGAIPGVDIGDGKFKDAEIDNIAGRDIRNKQISDDSDETRA